MVKGKIYAVLRFSEVLKTRINKGISGFLYFCGALGLPRSQSRRATKLRHIPKYVVYYKIFKYLCQEEYFTTQIMECVLYFKQLTRKEQF